MFFTLSIFLVLDDNNFKVNFILFEIIYYLHIIINPNKLIILQFKFLNKKKLYCAEKNYLNFILQK